MVDARVSTALHQSLLRFCGGGIIIDGTRHHQNTTGHEGCADSSLDWSNELKRLSNESISFPNGGGETRRRRKGKGGNNTVVGGGGGGNKPHDIEIRAALILYNRYSGHHQMKEKKKRKLQECSSRPTKTEMYNVGEDQNKEERDSARQQQHHHHHHHHRCCNLEIISDLGLARLIGTPYELAMLLSRDMEENIRKKDDDDEENHVMVNKSNDQDDDFRRISSQIIHDIRPDQSGLICLVTKTRSEELRLEGRLPCSICVRWCKGTKGLWWHQQREHGYDHSTATTLATVEQNTTSDLAIVPYDPLSKSLSALEAKSIHNNEGTRQGIEIEAAVASPKTSTSCNMANDERESDGMKATKNGDLNALINIVKRGYDPSSDTDRNGAHPIHWAAGSGHLALLKYLVNDCHCSPEQGQIDGKRSFRGRTPLHWSSRNGHLHVVKYLVEDCEVDLDGTTGDGTTAFCWACWQGHFDVMKYLYEKGCDPHKQNIFGCNAVLWSAQSKKKNHTTSGDDDNKNNSHSDHHALLDILKWLKSTPSCDFRLVNSNGHGILHKSAQRGNRQICEWIFSEILASACEDEEEDGGDKRFEEHQTSAKTNNACGKKHLPLDLIGPDLDGCCPSDLAGMEGHDDLGEWLAREEIELCQREFMTETGKKNNDSDANSSSTDEGDCDLGWIPKWLVKGMKDNGYCARFSSQSISSAREPRGGVRRMSKLVLELKTNILKKY